MEQTFLRTRQAALLALVLLTASGGRAAEPAAPTPLVQRCAPACVDLTGYSPNVGGYYDIGVGSGAIIHEKGYIPTVNHVARDELGGPPNVAHMQNGDTHRYRIVQRLGDDLAIIKIDVATPLPALKLGRSNRLEKGAPSPSPLAFPEKKMKMKKEKKVRLSDATVFSTAR